MKFEDLPEYVRFSVKFEESVKTENLKCPKCGKNILERRVYAEQNNWYVENCTDIECPYWTCGWL